MSFENNNGKEEEEILKATLKLSFAAQCQHAHWKVRSRAYESMVSSSSFDERFSGSFADPNHPGCPREITKNGVLRGYDPVPFEKGKGCRGRKVVTPEDVFAYPGKTMRYWEIQTKPVGKANNKDEIYIDFDQKDGSGEKVIAKLNENEEIVFPTGEVWKRRRGESFFP